MDYNSLTAQIQNYANRTDQDFINQIPDFINQAISNIYLDAKGIGFEQFVQGTWVAGNPFFAKPGAWRETIRFVYLDQTTANYTYLYPRSLEFCQTYWPTNARRNPEFYANYNLNTFYLAPTPVFANQFELTYLGLPLFNVANPTNFLTERNPNLLLNATLKEAAVWLKDDERLPLFTTLYDKDVARINADTGKQYIDRTSKRDQD